MARNKQDDGGGWLLVGAGLLATILGAAGTFKLSQGGNKSNGKSHTLTMTPGKKSCGCGMKKH